jgi:hypothetical protein
MITALQHRSPDQVKADIQEFPEKYVRDWETWLVTSQENRPTVFIRTLGKWQAIRGRGPLRRLAPIALHAPPYMDDLLQSANSHIQALQHSTMACFEMPPATERAALVGLWSVFLRLPQEKFASCVGISKAVMLLSDGRIGPAFDSTVKKKLGIPPPSSPDEWIRALSDVSSDIRAFEAKHGVTLRDVAPERFKHLAYGRLYDMAFGPR